MKIINDKYKKSRGGYSRILGLNCSNCGAFITEYQKDGPGPLKRLYIDRMSNQVIKDKLVCPNCKSVLGNKIIYEKENRPAFRLLISAVSKKIIKSNK